MILLKNKLENLNQISNFFIEFLSKKVLREVKSAFRKDSRMESC
jgi:hypothetical protein